MFKCNIRLGYDPEFAVPATLTATAIELVIKEVGCNPVTLAPNEVISFDLEGYSICHAGCLVLHAEPCAR
jgi:hypothetical protein